MQASLAVAWMYIHAKANWILIYTSYWSKFISLLRRPAADFSKLCVSLLTNKSKLRCPFFYAFAFRRTSGRSLETVKVFSPFKEPIHRSLRFEVVKGWNNRFFQHTFSTVRRWTSRCKHECLSLTLCFPREPGGQDKLVETICKGESVVGSIIGSSR